MRSIQGPCCRCPRCDTGSHVDQSCLLDTGDRVRRRACPSCGHTWYTRQPPEEMIDPWLLKWKDGVVKAIRPPAESRENEKV